MMTKGEQISFRLRSKEKMMVDGRVFTLLTVSLILFTIDNGEAIEVRSGQEFSVGNARLTATHWGAYVEFNGWMMVEVPDPEPTPKPPKAQRPRKEKKLAASAR